MFKAAVSGPGGGNSRQCLCLAFKATVLGSGGGNSRRLLFFGFSGYYLIFKATVSSSGRGNLSLFYHYFYGFRLLFEFLGYRIELGRGKLSRIFIFEFRLLSGYYLIFKASVSSSGGGNSRQFLCRRFQAAI